MRLLGRFLIGSRLRFDPLPELAVMLVPGGILAPLAHDRVEPGTTGGALQVVPGHRHLPAVCDAVGAVVETPRNERPLSAYRAVLRAVQPFRRIAHVP